jgi:hypothetical protein
MAYEIRYDGDDPDRMADYLAAVLRQSGAGNWHIQFTRANSTVEGRLHDVDTLAMTATVDLAGDDMEPTGKLVDVALHDVQEVWIP